MGGQKLLSLLQFDDRIDFFSKALTAIKNGARVPNDDLGLFAEDEHGTPLVWHKHYEEKQHRIERAYHNVALFELATRCDEWRADKVPLTPWSLYSSLVDVCSQTQSAGTEGVEKLLRWSEWETVLVAAADLLHNRKLNSAIALIEDTISMRLAPFLPIEEGQSEIVKRLSFRCYTGTSCLPDENLWTSIETLSNRWIRSSDNTYGEGYKSAFSGEELRACLEKQHGSLLTLSFDGNLAYFAIVYSDPRHIPKVTTEKIDRAVDAGFITAEKVDCWIYLVARDPQASIALHRAARADWYSAFIDSIGDLVISNGGERLVGRVLESNSSRAAHLRAGARSTGAFVIDENNSLSEIIAQELILF